MEKKKKNNRSKSGSKKTKSSASKAILLIVILIAFALLLGVLYTMDEAKNEGKLAAIKENVENKQNYPNETKEIKVKQSTTKQEVSRRADEPAIKPTVNKTINEDVPTYDHNDQYYFKTSFDFIWPEYDLNDQIIEHSAYVLKYNENTEQADWVAYRLTKADLSIKKVNRTDDYREDPRVTTGSATLNDYRRSGYDRGHLMPAGDARRSAQIMSETFYLSNISPQVHSFNDGVWRKLEEKIRSWTYRFDELFIVTGPIIKGKPLKKIGSNKVQVPTHYYKVILDLSDPEIKGIGFIYENKKYPEQDFMKYATSIDQVEKFTGINFFPALPDKYEKIVEGKYDVNRWK